MSIPQDGKSAAADGPKDASVTVRDVVHLSLGGRLLRLRISNEYGTVPLRLEHVHVAMSAGKDQIDTATDHAVLFGGEAAVTLAAGKSIVSDPVGMTVAPMASVAVSMYVPQQKEAELTIHRTALSSNFYGPGDQTSTATITNAHTVRSWLLLTGVDVDAPTDAAAIVTFGDSITDGMVSTVDANRRWPDDLARRLQAEKKTSELAVLNLGVSGNRILYKQSGPPLIERFDRDVMGQMGVKFVILFAGINDIGHATNRPDPAQKESVPDIIAGMKAIVMRAHSQGIKVFAGTITPFGGAPQFKPAGEQMRQQVNAWIRSGGGFDGVFDFDAALRDPKNPEVLAPAFDAPGHIHPNDAGYQAIADAIDISKFN